MASAPVVPLRSVWSDEGALLSCGAALAPSAALASLVTTLLLAGWTCICLEELSGKVSCDVSAAVLLAHKSASERKLMLAAGKACICSEELSGKLSCDDGAALLPPLRNASEGRRTLAAGAARFRCIEASVGAAWPVGMLVALLAQ